MNKFVSTFKENLKRQSKKLFLQSLQEGMAEAADSDEEGEKKLKFRIADTQLFRKLLM
jgi:hypothetical protein